MTSEQNHSTLRRFPIRQELNFEVITTFRSAETGTGKTISIGSKAVLFMTDQVLKLGNCLQLEISWPAIRDEATAVYLLLRGRIVHYEHPHALVAVERHEFQTRSHQKRCSRRQIDHVAFEISETQA